MAEIQIDVTLAPVLARTGDERAVLDAFLDFHRAIVLRKARGLTDAEATRRLVPSATTLAGLLRHLTLVERNWFPYLLDPAPGDVFPTSEEDAAASFALAEGRPSTRSPMPTSGPVTAPGSWPPGSRWTMSSRNRSSARCRCAGSWCT